MISPRVLAVIPARGGSRGLPGKNIRPLMGLPLLVHSVKCATLSKYVSMTIVSTDSDVIAAVARDAGAEVPFMRPAELARDDTPMFPVITHALERVESVDRRFDVVVLLDPTSPGRLPEEIDRAVEQLSSSAEAKGIVACSKPTFNPFWVGVVREGAFIKSVYEGASSFSRRQDVPDFFRINGALYAWKADYVRVAPAVWRDAPHLMLEMPEERAFSIDDLAEFELLEARLERRLIRLPWLPDETP